MTVDTFRTGFTGNVLVPTSEGYDDARALWNGDIDRRPAVIAQCRTADEVASSIRFGSRGGSRDHGAAAGGTTLPATECARPD